MTRLEELKERYEAYRKCEMAIIDGAQSYQIGSRQIIKATLFRVTDMIGYLEKEIAIETAKMQGKGRNRVIGVIPRDL